MRFIVSLLLVATFAIPLIGCNGNQYFAQRPFGIVAKGTPQDSQVAQLQELSRRITQLDANNRDLHTKIAQYEQDSQKKQSLVSALQKQLSDTANQLAQLQDVKQQTEQRLAGMQASTQLRGGATITANNSLRDSLQVVNVPGVEVRQDGDVIRIELPSDRLFVTGSAQMQQGAPQLIDQVSATIKQSYPRQRIGVEGHTDNSTTPGIATDHHQLGMTQSLAVFSQLVRSGRFSPSQLFVISHGSNHPRFSNGDPAGRSRNRRVEIVIYPETTNGQ